MKHSAIVRYLTLSATLLVCAYFCASGQAGISPDLLKQYQKQYGSNPAFSSSDRMQQLLSDYQKQKAGEVTAKTADRNQDEKRAIDSAAAMPAGDTIVPLSLYESLLRGINVHPDSQLPRLQFFGYDVFSKAKPTTFAPADFTSVPSSYPITSGDEVVVLLWGRINEEYRLRVSRDGTINIPRLGPLSIAGLPFDAMQKNILDRVKTIEGVNASVSMGELRSIGVYIVGEVSSPGFYTISALSSVTNALFAAGGPTKRGSLRTIQLKRNGKTVSTIDFYDFLLSGSDRTGLRLQSGDVILVPVVQSMVAIAGNVRRCALYELNGKTTLADALMLAGGLSPAAWTSRIQVERFMNNRFQAVIDVESSGDKIPAFDVNDGDIIKVFPVLERDKNTVYLSGNVYRPGKYEFKVGMRVTDLIPNAEALLPETYFNYGIILRQDPPSFLDRIVPFNLQNALASAASADNIALQPKDQVVIYNKDFFEPDRTISIDGAVTKPGTYKLLENMKIRDLVLQAGGLRDDASPVRGELYRRTINEKLVETEKIEFCVECAMNDDAKHNFPLLRADRVFIRQKKGWEDERKVFLKGQFMYPGTYVIFEGETLGDLIKRAGGFKDDAYLAASIFTRKSVRLLEEQRKKEYLQQLELNMLNISNEMVAKEKNAEAQAMLAQQMALKEKLSTVIPLGRIIVDLTKQENYSAFALEDSDMVFIPRNMNTISVVGEVFNPATFTFNSKEVSPWYYIESAGGIKESSDKKHIYVVKANGSIITSRMKSLSSINLEPGDAVVVPQKVRYSSPHKLFVDTMDAIFKMASTLAIVLSVVIALQAQRN
jgi:polysaccharide export outer membrane protein